MKLQNFLNSKMRYDAKAIAADDELSHQIQSRLIDLGLLKPPVDGKFGPLSTAALHRFQTLMKCGEAGFLGAVTATKLIEAQPGDIPTPPLILKTLRDTIFKSKPLASSGLQDSEKQLIPGGKEFEILAFAPTRVTSELLCVTSLSKVQGFGMFSDRTLKLVKTTLCFIPNRIPQLSGLAFLIDRKWITCTILQVLPM
jgi:hypothetical protein